MSNGRENADSQPWNGPRWATSRHNFDPAIAVPPRPVELHDLTLRDGEESADLAFTTADPCSIRGHGQSQDIVV